MVAKEDRKVKARRREEADAIAAALRQAEGGGSLRDLATTLWGRTQVLQGELTLAGERETALRAALLTTMAKLRRAEQAAAAAVEHAAGQQVRERSARVAAAEAERDAARAEEAAAVKREATLRKRLQAVEARLAALSTGAPSPVAHVEPVGQVTGAEVCLWVRQTRALSALRDVPAARWDRDDAAQLRRQVYRLQQCAPGAERAALSERAVELARALGGG